MFTWMVSRDEPEPGTVDGFQEAEVRAGRPLRLKETLPVKPWTAETVIVSEPLVPRGICKVALDSDSEKSPGELTFNFRFTE